MRADARHDREQDPTAAAHAEHTVRLIADELLIHLQRTAVWPASLVVCSGGWPPTWLLGRYGHPQSGLDNLGEFVDIKPGRGQRAVERLRRGGGLAFVGR